MGELGELDHAELFLTDELGDGGDSDGHDNQTSDSEGSYPWWEWNMETKTAPKYTPSLHVLTTKRPCVVPYWKVWRKVTRKHVEPERLYLNAVLDPECSVVGGTGPHMCSSVQLEAHSSQAAADPLAGATSKWCVKCNTGRVLVPMASDGSGVCIKFVNGYTKKGVERTGATIDAGCMHLYFAFNKRVLNIPPTSSSQRLGESPDGDSNSNQTILKPVGPGYCSDYKYLPEGSYPPRRDPQMDPVWECGERCYEAYQVRGFYLRDSDKRCACSKGLCKKPYGTGYSAYRNATIETISSGYCADYKYLPEGAYPPRKDPLKDPVVECAHRCYQAYQANAFYLRDSDKGCACSSGWCKKTHGSGYSAYRIDGQIDGQALVQRNLFDFSEPFVYTFVSSVCYNSRFTSQRFTDWEYDEGSNVIKRNQQGSCPYAHWPLFNSSAENVAQKMSNVLCSAKNEQCALPGGKRQMPVEYCKSWRYMCFAVQVTKLSACCTSPMLGCEGQCSTAKITDDCLTYPPLNGTELLPHVENVAGGSDIGWRAYCMPQQMKAGNKTIGAIVQRIQHMSSAQQWSRMITSRNQQCNKKSRCCASHNELIAKF